MSITPRVSEIFYLNINNGQLPRRRLYSYLTEALPRMFKAVKVPINLAIPSFDWAFIKTLFPELYSLISNNPLIQPIFTTFSHFMPMLFPQFSDELLLDQLVWSKQTYNRILNWKAMPPVGFLSEFSASQSSIVHISRFTKSILINEQFQDLLGVTPYESYAYRFPEDKIIALSTDYQEHYRENILGMYREETLPQTVVNNLREKAVREIGRGLLVVVCDFEVPFNNGPYEDKVQIVPHRIDLFEEYQIAAASSGIEFIHLNTELIESLEHKALNRQGLYLNPRRIGKWQICKEAVSLRACVSEEIARHPLLELPTYHRLVTHLACSADAYSSFTYLGERALCLPVRLHGKLGYEIVITGNVERQYEIIHFLSCLRNRTRINQNISPILQEFQWLYDGIDTTINEYSNFSLGGN